MKTYDVQEIEIAVPASQAFEWIADPARLRDWTHAFESADHRSARVRTPNGPLQIGLEVRAVPAAGTVDWTMRFPDGSVGRAHSRVVELADNRCVYAFVLHAPPGPLEAIEGALETQRVTLAHELERLKGLLERG